MKNIYSILAIFIISILISFASCKKNAGDGSDIIEPEKITEDNAIEEADKIMKEIDKI